MIYKKYKFYLVLSLASLFISFSFTLKNTDNQSIPNNIKWSERMALSVMKRSPDPRLIDGRKETRWEYTQGLVLKALEQVGNKTSKKDYNNYVLKYADMMVNSDGSINTYEIAQFNIDKIAPGRILFQIYDETKDEKYLKAINLLRNQLKWQPRTTEGGFWHKLIYPWQMWLDGLYMGSPFYTEYAARFNEEQSFDDIAQQLILMEKHARDPKTGLLYHGWDESRVQNWSDDQTGLSPCFWGRAVGWYSMALVDILEKFPENHKNRKDIIDILHRLAIALEKYQDPKTGTWYQVLDQGNREGNYLEASATSMFVYAIAKGVNKGYLPKSKMAIAEKGYNGIIKEFIKVDETGEVHITSVCEVAGLGGAGNRSGTYEYYINESRRDDDPKAVGPFILASLELNK